MGLVIHSLGELPAAAYRGFYVYLLDFGWKDKFTDAMHREFDRMAREAASADAVVMRGMPGFHFEDEVLSWHHINGEAAAELLPAILITTEHPRLFRYHFRIPALPTQPSADEQADNRLLLIPLKKVCRHPRDVIPLLAGIFRDIRQRHRLSHFEVARRMNAGEGGALRDAIILRPTTADRDLSMSDVSAFLRPTTSTGPTPIHTHEQHNEPDILIVTVNDIETKELLAAVAAATGRPAEAVAVGRRTYRNLGSLNGVTLFHALSSPGSGGPGAAQQSVAHAVRELRPRSVIALGVAFGLDPKRQKIGDILMSKQLSLYEAARIGTSKRGKVSIRARGDRPHASTRLYDYFRGAAFTSTLPAGATLDSGLMLSGEKLVDNLDYRKQLQALEPEAIGGEMEGAGLYTSSQDSHVDWLVIKAICDWADGNKARNKRARQTKAARNAADFFLQALRTTPLPSPYSSEPKPSSLPTPTDRHILQKFVEVLDRPAFTTNFEREDDFVAFRQAVTDTIEALNTGVWRLRDGTVIERIPNRHRLRKHASREAMAEAIAVLIDLRDQFNALVDSGDIQRCGCGKPDCKVYTVAPIAAQIMDDFRGRFLHQLHDAVEASEEQ